MKKKIKYQIKYIKLADVEIINGNVLTPKTGKAFSIIPIFESTLTQVSKTKSNRHIVQQKLILKDVITSDVLNSMQHPHIIELTLFNNDVFIWGSLDNPVQFLDASTKNGGTELVLIRFTPDFE